IFARAQRTTNLALCFHREFRRYFEEHTRRRWLKLPCDNTFIKLIHYHRQQSVGNFSMARGSPMPILGPEVDEFARVGGINDSRGQVADSGLQELPRGTTWPLHVPALAEFAFGWHSQHDHRNTAGLIGARHFFE